ncbi:unnamed protein product [Paramecium pentaurelia]|uniref:Uncharacterized protein n=1 Tax=Paramecium pentaurelia TaxID=43138 RepID=A0A8S1WTL2_9CILI|nr:unnamed protein product [Paramecium pentaurelia]
MDEKITTLQQRKFLYYFQNNNTVSQKFDSQSEQVFKNQQTQLIDIILCILITERFYIIEPIIIFQSFWVKQVDFQNQCDFLVGTTVKPFKRLSCNLFLAPEMFIQKIQWLLKDPSINLSLID